MKSFALLLLGAWLGGSLIVLFVATQNFRTVDRLLSAPTEYSRQPLAQLPHEDMRMLLRHLSSELNRLYFFWWGIAQIALGALLLVLLRKNRFAMILSATMLAIVALQALFMTPRVTTIGRQLDFVSRNPLPPVVAPLMAEFWRLHGAFTGSDLIVLICGLVLAWKLTSGRV